MPGLYAKSSFLNLVLLSLETRIAQGTLGVFISPCRILKRNLNVTLSIKEMPISNLNLMPLSYSKTAIVSIARVNGNHWRSQD